jgi:SAM-dependent methyltransferase
MPTARQLYSQLRKSQQSRQIDAKGQQATFGVLGGWGIFDCEWIDLGLIAKLLPYLLTLKLGRQLEQNYAIQGGRSGRERLRVLSHVLQGSTLNFLDRIGLRPGMSCLDVGCGGGDVTRELARRVGSGGRVVGLDMDSAQLNIVRAEAAAQNIANIDYRVADVGNPPSDLGTFDIVYARFLLCHLKRPGNTLSWMVERLGSGGVLATEDCDFTGHFCYPPLPAFDRYVELCADVMRRRGGDPHIGLKLPQMLKAAGLRIGGVMVAHPSDVDGDVKLVNALTMENIAQAVLSDGLASPEEVNQLVTALNACTQDERTFVSMTRIIQAWGRQAT